MKNKWFVFFVVSSFILAGCDTDSGGGGGNGSGGGDNVWSQLLGTWKSDDGKLEYEFEERERGGGVYKQVTITGLPP
jgi:predicted small secreted protein